MSKTTMSARATAAPSGAASEPMRGAVRRSLVAAVAITALGIAVAPAYGSDGTWDRAWGKDVVNGGSTDFEICTVAPTCKDGAVGSLGGELSHPAGVATDATGNVYVADTFNRHRIQKFDPQGNFLRAWGKDVDMVAPGTGFEICTVAANCAGGAAGGLGGELSSPAGVAVDGAGNVYVAEEGNERIQKFDPAGNFLRAWGRNVVQDGGPGQVCTDAQAVIVPEVPCFEVCTVAASCKGGFSGVSGGELSGPEDVAADPAGNVYVTDADNHRIQKFDPQGGFLRAWGKDVDTGGGTGFEICTVAASCKFGSDATALGGELRFPGGVTADGAGNVYVADTFNQRIQGFDPQGAFLRAWGKDVETGGGGTGFEVCTVAASCKAGATGGLGGELNFPTGVAADAAGSFYVGDNSNRRIHKFDPQGGFLRAWGKDVDMIALGTGFEICTVATSCKMGTPGGLGGEIDNPTGVATDPAGNVYVADDNHRIQKFAAAPATPVTPVAPVTPVTPAQSGPTGERAAALKKCKKKAKKKDWSKKRFNKCKKQANRLPV